MGLPSEILLRRPDVAEAEREMAAQHSLANAAFASFFPSITFATGSAGSSSMHLRYFLRGKGRLWSFGARGSQMLFDGGRLSADLAIQNSRFKEANDNYQQVVLNSLEEVENALSNLENYAKEADDVATSVEWSQRTYRIASNKYRNG